MHVMIATDGGLAADKAAAIVSHLVGDGDAVTVYSVVEVPRRMLQEMRAAAGYASGDGAIDPTVEYRDEVGEASPTRWIGDDVVVDRYVKAKVTERTGDLVAALKQAGISAEVVGEEGESVARTVLAAVESRKVDVLCIGSHGAGRFEGLLGTTSTKIARTAQCPVLLIR